MTVLHILLLVIEVVASLLLTGLILIQKSKSEGLGMAFGGGMGESLFGSRTGNVLTRLTIIFGIVFMVNTLALSMVYSGGQEASLMGERALPVAPPAAPAQARPSAAPSTTPSAPATGVPTLPGTDFDRSQPLKVTPVSPAPESDQPAPVE